MFDGNTADPATLASQISKLKQRFGVSHVVLVGDRGMITQARISDDVKPAGLDWIAYHVEWQMRARLKPMLYDDADKEAAEAARDSIVTKAQRSPKAVSKQTTGRTEDGLPVHSFHSLLADLATLTRNTIVTALAPDHPFTLTTRPTTIQQKALDLLGGAITRTQ